jgi:predicted ribosome quality control (RQC) complex YloA/Tae2 family protein
LDAPRLLAPQVLAIDAEDAAGTRHRLVLEANGDESNLLLLDGDGRLLIALRHPALPGRKLAPGDPYALPVKPRALPPGVPNELWAARAWDRSGGEAGARDWDARAREQEAGSSLEQQSRAARQQVRAELKKLRRRIEKQRDDLARAEEAEALRRFGELLKIHRARLAFGMADIVVPDEFDPARPDVTIALDPRLGPAENIERYFQRYRKLRAALPHIQSRLEEAEARLQGWEDAQTALDRIDSAQALAELFARLNLPSPVAKQAGGARRTRTSEPVGESHVLTRTSADGLTVLVGRSKEANDRVTFRLGNGRDWWFHAQGVPGSHVIVRSPSGAPPPERTVREAAWLAAYYSQRRQEGRVDVDYTQRKHVRKIKGAEPGQVTYSQNKTVLVDLSDTKASAILGETGD